MRSVTFKTALVISCLALSSFVACNKSGGGSSGDQPLSPLTAAQQARFDHTTSALGDATSLSSSGSTSSASSMSLTQDVSTDQASQRKAALQQKISESCVLNSTQPPTSVDQNNPSFTSGMSLKGDNCPVALSLDFAMNMQGMGSSSASMTMKLALMFKALTEDAKAAMDVQEYILNLNVGATSTSINGSGSGDIVSTTDGRVAISYNISGAADQSSGNSVVTTSMVFTYPDGLRVELKEVDAGSSSAGTKSSYFINNKSVDETTYNSYMSKITHGTAVNGSVKN